MVLTEERKRQAKITLLNDKVGEILSHLETLTNNDLAFSDWELDLKKWKVFAPDTLKLEFKLSEEAIKRRIVELDRNQKKIDEEFNLDDENTLEDDLEDLNLEEEEEIEH